MKLSNGSEIDLAAVTINISTRTAIVTWWYLRDANGVDLDDSPDQVTTFTLGPVDHTAGRSTLPVDYEAGALPPPEVEAAMIREIAAQYSHRWSNS